MTWACSNTLPFTCLFGKFRRVFLHAHVMILQGNPPQSPCVCAKVETCDCTETFRGQVIGAHLSPQVGSDIREFKVSRHTLKTWKYSIAQSRISSKRLHFYSFQVPSFTDLRKPTAWTWVLGTREYVRAYPTSAYKSYIASTDNCTASLGHDEL
jgi:hypothetical protein